jgi:hypothetical protein
MQTDVETFFIRAYYLITGCMGSYWNGLFAKRGVPWFYWSEFQMPRPGAKNYVNWGFDSALNQTEPVPLPWAQQWVCGASMLNESTASGAWGWSNKNCTNKYVSICKISRKCPGGLPSWPRLPLRLAMLRASAGGPSSLAAPAVPPWQCCALAARQLPHPSLSPRCRAAPSVFNYTSKINNSTYMLNTNTMAFEGAESFCNDYGGHLVSYGSKAEQQEVGSAADDACTLCAPHARLIA